MLFIGTPLYAYGYSYKTGTTLVSSLTVSTNAASTSDVYTYTYNNLGYITNIKKNGATIASYSYDALGQLVSETNNQSGEIYVYTYDKAGNITKKEVYTGSIANLTDTVNYTYSTSAWGDLLTNYDGNTITYDSMGNPTKWVGIAALTWNGRQLTYLSEDGLDHGVAFTYNADGVRTKKTFYDYDGSVTTHNYVLDGTTIVKETVTSGNSTTTLEYYYDESGIVSVRYNGTLYHYIKNLQGDVIGIVNSNSGAFVVEYTYDAWGNILSTTGTMASTLGQVNPFRYRGYYYDGETGLYYLNSRYYDAEVGRFISADIYVSTGQGILGNNMFAYCLNNPVNSVDDSGSKAKDFEVEKSLRSASASREIPFTFFTVTVKFSVEYTALPEFNVTLSSADISYSDGELSIELPDGETLSFEVSLSGIKPDSISFPMDDSTHLYDSNMVLDKTGVGFDFVISTDDVEYSGQITFRPSLKFDSNDSSDGSSGLGAAAIAIGLGVAVAGMGFGGRTLQPQRAVFSTVGAGF